MAFLKLRIICDVPLFGKNYRFVAMQSLLNDGQLAEKNSVGGVDLDSSLEIHACQVQLLFLNL
jgi:hypothetical protein